MTKRIGLNYQYTLVDDELYEWLNQWEWWSQPSRHTHYAVRRETIDGKTYTIQMHRLILGLEYGDGKISDHINRNGLDNRCSNLRVVDIKTNMLNHVDNSSLSGHVGVDWNSKSQMWRVHIGAGEHQFLLGCFTNLDNAIIARKNGEADYWHGGYANKIATPPYST